MHAIYEINGINYRTAHYNWLRKKFVNLFNFWHRVASLKQFDVCLGLKWRVVAKQWYLGAQGTNWPRLRGCFGRARANHEPMRGALLPTFVFFVFIILFTFLTILFSFLGLPNFGIKRQHVSSSTPSYSISSCTVRSIDAQHVKISLFNEVYTSSSWAKWEAKLVLRSYIRVPCSPLYATFPSKKRFLQPLSW